MLTYRQEANPYIVGGPIKDKDQFFGREDELRIIFDRIRTGQSTSLIGEPRAGNTSLLFQIMQPEVQTRFLPDDTGLVPVYIDFEAIPEPSDFYREVVRVIEDHSEERGESTHRFGEVVNVQQLVHYLNGLPYQPVLLLDEFEYVSERFDPDFLAVLRRIALNHPLITATRMGLSELFSDARFKSVVGSPLFNIFFPVYVGSFTEEEFDYFLEETSRRSGVSLVPYREEILDWAGRFPFYVQMACWHLFEEAREAQGQLSTQQLSKVRGQFQDHAMPNFEFAWANTIGDSGKQALRAVAEGRETVETLDEETRRRLLRKGYLIDNRIFSRVFAKWIRSKSRDELREASMDGPFSSVFGQLKSAFVRLIKGVLNQKSSLLLGIIALSCAFGVGILIGWQMRCDNQKAAVLVTLFAGLIGSTMALMQSRKEKLTDREVGLILTCLLVVAAGTIIELFLKFPLCSA